MSAAPRRSQACGGPNGGTTRLPADSYAWLVRSTAFINFFTYCVDADFAPVLHQVQHLQAAVGWAITP